MLNSNHEAHALSAPSYPLQDFKALYKCCIIIIIIIIIKLALSNQEQQDVSGWSRHVFDGNASDRFVAESYTTSGSADAKRDGRPPEYNWRPLRKFVIPFLVYTAPQSLADCRCASAVQ